MHNTENQAGMYKKTHEKIQKTIKNTLKNDAKTIKKRMRERIPKKTIFGAVLVSQNHPKIDPGG